MSIWNRIKNYFDLQSQNRWVTPKREWEGNDVVEERLRGRNNLEIAARLLRRAELHEERGGYPARCSPMDRVASERILLLEEKLAILEERPSIGIRDEFNRMMDILRNPS